jgi:CheY-like chemotaxis protein
VTILLVEDNLLIALEAKEMLTDLGARLVVSASTLRAAEEALSAHEFGFAMLDVSVGRGTSFGLACRLRAAGCRISLPPAAVTRPPPTARHTASIIVQKPYERDHLRRATRQAMRDRLAAV